MRFLKRFLFAAFVAGLAFNAGRDATLYYSKHKVEARVAQDLVKESPGIAEAKVRDCFNVKDFGYICDVNITLVDGRKGRTLLQVPYEDVK